MNDLAFPNLSQSEDGASFMEVLSRIRDGHGAISLQRKVRDESAHRIATSTWEAIREQGWAAAILPEAHGGLDQPLETVILGARVLGAGCIPVPFTTNCVMVPRLLAALEHGEASEAFLATGSWWGVDLTCADSIIGTSDALTGTTRLSADAMGAEQLVLAATINGNTALVLVDANVAEMELRELADRRNRAQVRLDAVQCEVLVEGERASKLIADLEAVSRLADAAEMLGMAEMSFSMAIDYLKTRRQFGAIIGTFQALQHRAARAFCELECARGILWSSLLDGARDLDEAAMLCKAEIGRIAGHVLAESFQFHGGIAMTDEFDLGLLLKRVRVLDALNGTQSELQDRLAARWGY